MSTRLKRRAGELLAGMKRPRMGRRLVSLVLSVAAMGLCVAVFDRIGAGTVANMVFVGYIAEFFMDVFDALPALSAMTLPVRMAVFVPTMALFLLAASIYMVVDLGVAPYDGVPQIIAAHTRRMSFRAVRMCWDVGVMTLGFLLGSTVGLTTVVTGFCLGPAIAAVGNRVRRFYEE